MIKESVNNFGRVKPDFIIPGFPKTGTTWIYDQLCELPDFEMPPVKELHYFNRSKKYDKNKRTGGNQNYFINRKRLLRNFNYSGVSFFSNYLAFNLSNDELYHKLLSGYSKLTGDITPTYCLLSDKGVKKMSELINGTNIVFVLRDPVERAWSQFRMNLRKNNQSLSQYENREIINFMGRDTQLLRSNYSEAITSFRKHFTDSSIAITFYDYLSKDPIGLLVDLVSFLGGNPSNIKSLSQINKKSNVSKDYIIPDVVYNYLNQEFRPEYLWLSKNIGGYCNKWASNHGIQISSINREITDDKNFILLNTGN